MRASLADRWRARRAMSAMRAVLKAHGFAGRRSTANDWQETWTNERVQVVLSRLPAAGNAEAEVTFVGRRGRAGATLTTYSPAELGEIAARAYGAR